MKQGVYSVRDDVSEVFCLPYCCMNDNVAVRSFYYGCNDPQSQISKAPGDYALYHVGEFDDDTGVMISVVPRLVVRGTVNKEG